MSVQISAHENEKQRKFGNDKERLEMTSDKK